MGWMRFSYIWCFRCHLQVGRMKKKIDCIAWFTVLFPHFFQNRFDAVIISSEVGHEKPNPKIFGAALGMCLDGGSEILNTHCYAFIILNKLHYWPCHNVITSHFSNDKNANFSVLILWLWKFICLKWLHMITIFNVWHGRRFDFGGS